MLTHGSLSVGLAADYGSLRIRPAQRHHLPRSTGQVS